MDLTFKRGTTKSFVIGVPLTSWEEGSMLTFTAKPNTDDDPGDSAAEINIQITEDNKLREDSTRAFFDVVIQPEDTKDIPLEGSMSKSLQGEFTVVQPNGSRIPFPDTEYVNITIIANIRNS